MATDFGLAAIELVDELAPDAAVLDLHMPLLDGVSACAASSGPPSSLPRRIDRRRRAELHRAAMDSGADEVLLKTAFVGGLLTRLTARSPLYWAQNRRG